jgi:hypothetical protein
MLLKAGNIIFNTDHITAVEYLPNPSGPAQLYIRLAGAQEPSHSLPPSDPFRDGNLSLGGDEAEAVWMILRSEAQETDPDSLEKYFKDKQQASLRKPV